jgi:hypothetical protein
MLLLFLHAPSTYSKKVDACLGSKHCETCHSGINAVWQKTRHAKAIESLKKSKQALSVKNEGSLPLIIARIISKDGKTIYFDGAKQGNIVIESAQTKTIEIQLSANNGDKPEREYILVDCNAKNAGESGYFLIVQYSAR